MLVDERSTHPCKQAAWLTREWVQVCDQDPLSHVELSPIHQHRILNVLLYNVPLDLVVGARVRNKCQCLQETPNHLYTPAS